jgi:hypothetical protein
VPQLYPTCSFLRRGPTPIECDGAHLLGLISRSAFRYSMIVGLLLRRFFPRSSELSARWRFLRLLFVHRAWPWLHFAFGAETSVVSHHRATTASCMIHALVKPTLAFLLCKPVDFAVSCVSRRHPHLLCSSSLCLLVRNSQTSIAVQTRVERLEILQSTSFETALTRLEDSTRVHGL